MARISAVGVALIGLLAAAPSASATPILDGDFETGLAGWTVNPAPSGSLLFTAGHGPAGNDSAWFGGIGGQDDVLSQTFATQPGQSYTFSFSLGHGATDFGNDFSVRWNGALLLMLNNSVKFGQTLYTFVVQGNDPTSTIRFSGRDRFNYFYLDDVTVSPFVSPLEMPVTVPTPEPASLLLVAAGMAAWTGRFRARRRAPR